MLSEQRRNMHAFQFGFNFVTWCADIDSPACYVFWKTLQTLIYNWKRSSPHQLVVFEVLITYFCLPKLSDLPEAIPESPGLKVGMASECLKSSRTRYLIGPGGDVESHCIGMCIFFSVLITCSNSKSVIHQTRLI